MNAEKIRNMTDAELQHQERELNDQLFRLKFQLKMGQTESLKKIRDLRKDVARVKTIGREKQLGLVRGSGAPAAAGTASAAPETKSASAARPAKKKITAGKTAKPRAKAGKK